MIHSRRYQYFAAFGVSLAAMTTALATLWGTPVIPKFMNNETSIDLTSNELSWVMSIISPGSVAGSVAAGVISDMIGRQTTILTSALPFFAGTVLILTASQAWMLYIGRFLWGCGMGMVTTMTTIYLSEIADKEIRGTLIAATRIMYNFSGTLVLVIGSYVSYQALSYMMFGTVACYFLVCWWIPETPYFHLKEGKVEEARQVIKKLSGLNYTQGIDDRLTTMQADVKKEMMRSSSPKELFTGKQYRKAIIVCVGLRVTQAMTGSYALQQYVGAIILENSIGIDVSTALIVYGAAQFLIVFVSSAIIDRVGRRPLLIFSYIGAGLLLALNGTYFFNQEAITQNETLNRFSIIVFIILVLCKMIGNLGFDTLILVIPGEIFPLNVRSTALGIHNIFSAFVLFMAVRGYQILKDLAGLHGVFWFYSVMAFIGAVFTYYCVPETKGKSLRDIQEELQGD